MYDVKRNITISEYLKQRVRDLTASPLEQFADRKFLDEYKQNIWIVYWFKRWLDPESNPVKPIDIGEILK